MSILMIEAGPNNHQELNIVTPFLLLSNLMPGSKTVSFHTSPKSSLLADREVTIPAARVLGGGSSINMLIYSRAQQSDFDSWGMPGWSTNELIPYMRKVNMEALYCTSSTPD
jgi:choline dehydrogenase-like flavoprotein